ncbi:glycosyltransferase family 4 protein [Telmatospirillum siberiense]|uniref:Glycosyltransferase subfamily 4-like N-terminal domain-containing protein n=1 Tax=Telmatospirillum siberiense TaxID=382514 RepID=A0A2N3PUI0_9PROT|nr:glycosyltransferase family 4 protein [Telmatospirillum siberiense]PKU24057.1 hypothetical protein CWS72_13225 [Telmatospirillum siberiense]
MSEKILLLQDALFLPSLGGGNKANRLLMSELAARGFDCRVVSRMPGPPYGPEFLAGRDLEVRVDGAGTLSYHHQGVGVMAVDTASPDAVSCVEKIVRAERPDWILVSDDHRAVFLDAALRLAPDRVVILVHTHFHLPFGPDARTIDPDQHARMRRARGIVAVSDYSRRYLRDHGGLASVLVRFPVFGRGPFEHPGRPEAGQVTMINPCLIKGLPIFLDLADHFPDVSFAAVPTWGADDAVLGALSRRRNITLLEPSDDIGSILRETRILVAPSLVPETFGYVSIDAMLRGIPVLAGGLGGQREAKLGVDFTLPVHEVRPAEGGGHASSRQPRMPWRKALETLLTDTAAYLRCATASRRAALDFLPETEVHHFIGYLDGLRG